MDCDLETVVDYYNNTVTDTDGSFKESSRSLWSTENDGGQINKGGAGSVLQKKVETNFTTSGYYNRMLYTFKGGALTRFNKENMEPADFGASTDEEEAEIINFMYGFAYDADASNNNNPTAVRNWILGDIIHSEPLVLDYVDDTYTRSLTDRYIAIGSNHGILHVFDTEDGSELFGFVPPSLLTSLDNFDDPTEHVYALTASFPNSRPAGIPN
jgi:type IV pilus assembly protein PilY1